MKIETSLGWVGSRAGSDSHRAYNIVDSHTHQLGDNLRTFANMTVDRVRSASRSGVMLEPLSSFC
jgi:hypothetical protein